MAPNMPETRETRVANMDADTNLLFAVPKKGRLYDNVVNFLNGAGLEYNRPHRLDIAHCTSLPVTLVFLPASDIAAYVGDGNVDLGITGQDIVAETRTLVHEEMAMGFGKCSLSVQAPIKDGVKDVAEIAGKRVVTSFPNIAGDYFRQFGSQRPTQIKYVAGSVEAACGLGLADAIVDLVETGTTMKAAGLEVIGTIMKTEAVLISNPNTKHAKLVAKIRKRLLGFQTAQKFRMISYNVAKSALKHAIAVSPGRRAPTISTLLDDQFCAVNVMVDRHAVADIMDDLYDVGATDIMVFDMENCRA
ncbi:Aste57867_23103 [Aphanomyces stellatus]|uniref:ATP phosphoribosyltransferase n=1 Tax=Aphanomyces stellatus TaxID=120398 RepID=A0A485LLV0_9STRA|nr:hypothetical protein As57867_023032 [Aphanomyces stellatus]VFT99751.1 Aste57867_23103 [Aphanomyces stellatus]